MSRWNHVRLLLLLFLFLIPISSCRRHSSSETYFLVSASLQIPYWQQAGKGFADAAALLKVHAQFVGPQNYDLKAEQQALQQAVHEKPAGILLHVAEPGLLTYDINQAVAAGIPVVTIDADAPASKRLFFIGTNNHQVGWLGGQRLLRGYREALAHYPHIRVVRVVDIAGNPHVAFDTVTDILAGQRDQVDAFVSLESQSGREVATVLNHRKVQNKVVIAMDAEPETLEWIRKGVIAATIAQRPYTMAWVGLRMLDDLHHNLPPHLDAHWSNDSFAPVPAFVDTGSTLVDKNNVDSFTSQH